MSSRRSPANDTKSPAPGRRAAFLLANVGVTKVLTHLIQDGRIEAARLPCRIDTVKYAPITLRLK
jgi:hypothetical protein